MQSDDFWIQCLISASVRQWQSPGQQPEIAADGKAAASAVREKGVNCCTEGATHLLDVLASSMEADMPNLDNKRVSEILNNILEQELAGVIRYTHYSFLVFGHGRIPIVSWLRDQANESLLHAHQAGEMITHLGAYPSLEIGPLLDRHQSSVDAILHEALEAESKALELYRALLEVVAGKSVMLEEYARQMILAEELHAGEVRKMLRRPGSIGDDGPPEGK